MFGQFSEQFKKSTQPASELLAANVKALEAVTAQQTQFFSGLVDDSVKLMQSVAQQTEVKSILAAQSVYAESLRERLTSTSKNTYGTLNAVSKQYADTLKSGFETASEAAQESVKAASSQVANVTPVSKPKPAKASPAKKAASKVASKATPAETAPKASVAKKAKPVTAKKVSKAKSTSPVATKKPVAKAATTVKPEPKSAAKPVATLSAEEVKAPTKTKSRKEP
mmetsp:Transcript_18110/g.58592  ORF Transcript_18110/g.58592 Transcript_18110/m.58592 type:complete len:225 (-) Transcript_18110:28-702(-)